MKKYILQIKESAIAKNIATLVSGNIIGYAIKYVFAVVHNLEYIPLQRLAPMI